MKNEAKSSVQQAARLALTRVLSQLAELSVDAGISVTETEHILRQASVDVIARRQMEEFGRVNVSRIAAISGLSRSAVAKTLQIPRRKIQLTNAKTQVTNRVLGAWYRDPKFTGQNGIPALLPIYGKGATFESLTRKYGGGVPVRAVLDELLRVSAVEVLSDQRVRARSMIAVNRGVNCELIESIGLRTSDLLSTLLANLRQNEPPHFAATVQSSNVPQKNIAFIRREIEKRSTAFLSDVEETLLPKSSTSTRGHAVSGSSRIGVTIFYHGESPKNLAPRSRHPSRKNLRRI